MQKLMTWLESEASGTKQITGYVLLAALVYVALDYTVRATLINWGIVEYEYNPNPQHPFKYFNVLAFVSILVRAPILEETIFRLVPLAITIFFTRKPSTVLATTVIFATLFGAIHPYDLIGNIQVAIGGVVFGVVFLKCGGLQGRVLKAWGCSIATHSASNLFILVYEYYNYLEQVL